MLFSGHAIFNNFMVMESLLHNPIVHTFVHILRNKSRIHHDFKSPLASTPINKYGAFTVADKQGDQAKHNSCNPFYIGTNIPACVLWMLHFRSPQRMHLFLLCGLLIHCKSVSLLIVNYETNTYIIGLLGGIEGHYNGPYRVSRRAHNRWFVAYTLIKNPSLRKAQDECY